MASQSHTSLIILTSPPWIHHSIAGKDSTFSVFSGHRFVSSTGKASWWFLSCFQMRTKNVVMMNTAFNWQSGEYWWSWRLYSGFYLVSQLEVCEQLRDLAEGSGQCETVLGKRQARQQKYFYIENKLLLIFFWSCTPHALHNVGRRALRILSLPFFNLRL